MKKTLFIIGSCFAFIIFSSESDSEIFKRIVSAIVLFVCYIFIFFHKGKTIHDKAETQKEREYIETLELLLLPLLYFIFKFIGAE